MVFTYVIYSSFNLFNICFVFHSFSMFLLLYTDYILWRIFIQVKDAIQINLSIFLLFIIITDIIYATLLIGMFTVNVTVSGQTVNAPWRSAPTPWRHTSLGRRYVQVFPVRSCGGSGPIWTFIPTSPYLSPWDDLKGDRLRVPARLSAGRLRCRLFCLNNSSVRGMKRQQQQQRWNEADNLSCFYLPRLEEKKKKLRQLKQKQRTSSYGRAHQEADPEASLQVSPWSVS